MTLRESMYALGLIGLMTTHSMAGQIDGGVPVTNGNGSITFDGDPDWPGEYDNSQEGGNGLPSNNVILPIKSFTKVGPMDIVIQASNTGGVTSYEFNEQVTNNTGITWTDFHFLLGTGTGNGFVPYGLGAPVTFDLSVTGLYPDPNSSDTMALVLSAPNELGFLKPGTIPNGATANFIIQILVGNDVVSPFTFTLRELPTTIPEPSSLALAGLGGLGLAIAAYRRRRLAA